MKPHPRLLDLAIYPHRVDVTSRFSDLDPQQHLNNARLTEFYQEARLSFYHRLRNEHGYQRPSGTRILVVHLDVDYLGEVDYPGTVTIGLGVTHIGTTSHSVKLALFTQGRCVGLSTAVLVYTTEEGATALPKELRGLLEQYLLPKELQRE